MGGSSSPPAARKEQFRCGTCLSIDARRPFYGPESNNQAGSAHATRVGYSHAPNLYALLDSALDQGCHLCILILEAIRKHYILLSNKKNVLGDWDMVDDVDDFDDSGDDDSDSDEASTEERARYGTFFYRPQATLEAVTNLKSPIILDFVFRERRPDESISRCVDVVVHWTQTGGRTRLSCAAFVLVSQIPHNIAELCEKREIWNDTSTSSNYSFDLARLWNKQCDTQHELCRKRIDQRELLFPTRVIDVGDIHTEPRLVEPLNSHAADYACLSHCWGKSQPFVSDSTTIDMRKSGLDMKAMPRTFQDAIIVTRNLGIQYLWIDSLCIIQDSAEDWARESAQMGRIYRDAALTIFAEHADSDEGGCFSPRSGTSSALCRTPTFDSLYALLRKTNEDDTQTFIQAHLDHAGTHSMPEEHSIFETSKSMDGRLFPLNLRAWVLQESILSHRSLKYNQYEVCWFCPTMTACECLPEGHIRRAWSQDDKGDVEAIKKRELTNAWATIVTEFSTRRLTYNKDKLAALAGVASEMQRYKSSRYLAGLWEDDLRLNLSWRVRHRSPGAPYRETKQIVNSTAPSWSWAKIEGNIDMPMQFSNPVGDGVAQDGYTFGDKNSNRVLKHNANRANHLTCSILSCTTIPIDSYNPFSDIKRNTGILHLRGPLGKSKSHPQITDMFNADRIPIVPNDSDIPIGWFDPDVYPIPDETPIPEIWCIPLHAWHSHLTCLALVQTPGEVKTQDQVKGQSSHAQNQHRTFKRVGIVTPLPTHTGTGTDQFEPLLSWFERCRVEDITVL